jgi:Ca-activated chloride channel family protein
MDMNRIYDAMKQRGLAFHNQQNVSLDPRYLHLLDVDLRVVLSWDHDMVDVELQCEEPTGDVCSAFRNSTRIGGNVWEKFGNKGV